MDQEESDLREALRRSLLETESARASSSGPVGLHVECDEMWGELTEEEALALAMDLSEQQERRERESRAEMEAAERYYRLYPSDETGNEDRDGIDGVDSDLANEGEDAELREALRLSALHAEAEATRREAFVELNHSSVMPASMDEDAALEAALRLSALEADGGASRDADTSTSPRVDANANADVLQWAAAQLSAFTGEAENDVLAEYVVRAPPRRSRNSSRRVSGMPPPPPRSLARSRGCAPRKSQSRQDESSQSTPRVMLAIGLRVLRQSYSILTYPI